jgi:hypothetical protein
MKDELKVLVRHIDDYLAGKADGEELAQYTMGLIGGISSIP